jgi:hypothetical protein
MSRLLKNLTILGLVAAGLAGVASNAAQAGETQYGAVVINNPSDNVLHYQMRWGDGAWSNVCLQPHTDMTHWMQLDCHGRADVPEVRFVDTHGCRKVYSLDFYATCHPNDQTAKMYSFQYSRNGRNLDLYAD